MSEFRQVTEIAEAALRDPGRKRAGRRLNHHGKDSEPTPTY
jgi:hypothetical protein